MSTFYDGSENYYESDAYKEVARKEWGYAFDGDKSDQDGYNSFEVLNNDFEEKIHKLQMKLSREANQYPKNEHNVATQRLGRLEKQIPILRGMYTSKDFHSDRLLRFENDEAIIEKYMKRHGIPGSPKESHGIPHIDNEMRYKERKGKKAPLQGPNITPAIEDLDLEPFVYDRKYAFKHISQEVPAPDDGVYRVNEEGIMHGLGTKNPTFERPKAFPRPTQQPVSEFFDDLF